MARRPVLAAAVLVAAVAVLATTSDAKATPGDFTSAGVFPAGNGPYGIALGDFNGDAVPDAAVPNVTSNDLSILLGDGVGRFTSAPGSPKPTGPGPDAVVVGQFGGDSDADLAVAESNDDSVLVLIGRGDGRFHRSAAGPVDVGDRPFALTASDLNSDGDTDLAVANESDDSVTILLGNGSGGFDEAGTSPEEVGDSPLDLAVADLNGGAPDLAVVNSAGNSVSVLLADGTGGFNAPASSPEPLGAYATSIVAANLDGGGVRDLAASGEGPATHILLGSGLGDFTTPATSPEAGGSHDIVAADLDGDGDQDLAAPESFDSEVAILLNDGGANFAMPATSPEDVLALPHRVAAGDLDTDSDEDLVVVGGNGGIESLLNDEPDGDSDGIADQADDCPGLADPGGCPAVARTITLSYSKARDRFAGGITGDADECERVQRVEVFRKRPGGGRQRVGSDKTNQEGHYRVNEPDAKGRYFAESKLSIEPEAGACAPAKSNTVRVG